MDSGHEDIATTSHLTMPEAVVLQTPGEEP